jgi:putative flippase GtrA
MRCPAHLPASEIRGKALVLRFAIDALIRPFFTRRFLKFALVGASGVIVNLGCLALFRALHVQINLASALAIELSLLSNFVINHLWTFGDADPRGGLLAQALRFHVVCLGGAVLQFASFVVLNMVWLFLLHDAEVRFAYLSVAQTWSERWLWRPFVSPPDVGSWVFVSQLLGIGCGMVWNYLLNFYWTWSVHKRDARGAAHET